MTLAPLWFALGVAAGLFSPTVFAWVMSIGESSHQVERARRVPLEQMIDEALGEPTSLIPRQHGRHSAPVREQEE